MKFLFTQNGIVVGHGSVSGDGFAIANTAEGVRAFEVPDDSPVTEGYTVTMVDGQPVFAAPVPPAPKVSPVQFKLLFAPAERVAMDAATATDPVLKDFFSIVNDPRLTYIDLGLQSTKDAVAYLVGKNFITQVRADEILAGVLK